MNDRALASVYDDPILSAASATFDKLVDRVPDENLQVDLLEAFEAAIEAAGRASIEAGR